jgi:hypothetical protein
MITYSSLNGTIKVIKFFYGTKHIIWVQNNQYILLRFSFKKSVPVIAIRMLFVYILSTPC